MRDYAAQPLLALRLGAKSSHRAWEGGRGDSTLHGRVDLGDRHLSSISALSEALSGSQPHLLTWKVINTFVVGVFAKGFYGRPGTEGIGLANAGQYLGEAFGDTMRIAAERGQRE